MGRKLDFVLGIYIKLLVWLKLFLFVISEVTVSR